MLVAILCALALAVPVTASASELGQRHGVHVGVGHPWHGVGWGRPFGFGIRGPIVVVPPPLALPPLVVPVAVPVSVPVAVPQPVAVPYAPPQVNYAPALPLAAPCGCPQ